MNNVSTKQESFKVKREDVEEIAAFNSPPKAVMDQTQMASTKAPESLHTGLSGTSSYGADFTSANGSKEIFPPRVAQDGLAAASPVSVAMNAVPHSDGLLVDARSLHMDDPDLYDASPMRPSGPETRNNLKRTIDYEESDDGGDDDDDEVGPVRNSRERAKRQRTRVSRTKPAQSSDIKIGHHTSEPLVPIFAKFKKRHLENRIVHIYSRKMVGQPEVFPSGKSWSDYVHKNCQVNLDDVTLDPELVPGTEESVEDMTVERKRQLISGYLHGILSEGNPTISIEASTPEPMVQVDAPMYEHGAPFIIGFHKDDLGVPVRAQLRLQSGSAVAAVLFRLEAGDIQKSNIKFPGVSVHESKIKFNPEFARPTIEETKAEILSRFRVKHNELQDGETFATTSQHAPRGRQNRVRQSKANLGNDTPGCPRIELPTGSSGRVDECLESLQNIGQNFLTMAFDHGEKLKKRDAAMAEREYALAEKEALVKRREENVDEEIAAGVETALEGNNDLTISLQTRVEQLEKEVADNTRMQEQIKNLTAQLEEARKQSSNATQISAPVPSTEASSSLFLDLNGMMFSQAYTKIAEDNPNSGWFWQNQTDTVVFNEGPLQGKKFTRNQVLQPITGITVPGRLKDTALRCGDLEYLHFEEDGIAKLVQNSNSVVQHEGQHHVRWTYLREVRESAIRF